MSAIDSPSERMVAQLSEFAEAERRFRRYRCLLLIFFVIVMLSLLIYLLLTWELSEEPDDFDQQVERNTSTFTIILAVSVCTLAGASISSFIALEISRRRYMRRLTESQNAEMRRYFPERASIYGTNQLNPTAPSSSDQSSWVGGPPGSDASSPPPAYDECFERR